MVQIQWLLDEARPGRVRREIHEVRPDAGGLSMAFLYDTAQKTGHLVGGQIMCGPEVTSYAELTKIRLINPSGGTASKRDKRKAKKAKAARKRRAKN